MWSQDIEAFRGMNILTPTVHDGTILQVLILAAHNSETYRPESFT